MAIAWRDALREKLGSTDGPVAMVMANDPPSVALLFALSCFPVPLIVLPPDLKAWGSSPPLPAGTRLVLPPAFAGLAAEAGTLGFETTVLGDPDGSSDARDIPRFMATPGFVLFTSGSTERPRPVYRSTAAIFSAVRALMAAVGLSRGSGLIATLPLARAFGLNQGVIAATVLEGPLALLERFDHRRLLRLFSSRQYRYWTGTPMMADVLSRCRLTGAHPAPPVCLIGGRVPADVAQRFEERFGVPLRSYYGSTETGSISVDVAPASEVRSDTTGRPVPGVRLCIGDPRAPYPAGTLGRIWVSSPQYLMQGYGFPPDLEPPETVNGWWATPDVGSLDATGSLTIAGRLDDCFRTDAGHLVNPGAVAAALEGYPGITDSAVVPIATSAGPVLGVLVQSATRVTPGELRGHLLRSVPAWSQPRVVETTDALPRLANGRIDRRACITLLETSLARGEP
jgi:long-chain acyl-CoA synthetase